VSHGSDGTFDSLNPAGTGPEPPSAPIWLRPAITLGGLLLFVTVVWSASMLFGGSQPSEAPKAPADDGGIADLPPLPPPEDSPVFEAVRDREPISFRETAAYRELLERVRSTPAEELQRAAREDIVFSDLLERPERYRGLPIKRQGTARRILRLEDIPETLAPEGALYEAWTYTSDSRGYPYVFVFEDPPEGLPAGDDVRAFVTFQGYFLKLLAYSAADKPRVAPMLIGRLQYVPEAEPEPIAPGPSSAWSLWIIVPIAAILVYLVFRGTSAVRSSLGGRAARGFRPPPKEEISPEELNDWLSRPAEGEAKAESDGPFGPDADTDSEPSS